MGVFSKLLVDQLFHGLRRTFGLIQGIWWAVTGTYFQRWRSRSNYDWSAQVLTVLFRHKLDLVLEPSGPDNFISLHHSFQHPKYVLKDNITLYYVTRQQAVFVESDPKVDVTNSDEGPFIRVAQFENARKIIIIPIKSFHKLADSLGEIKGKLIFVSNTARCGSTLLSQVFEETGRVLSISEPDALNAIGFYQGKIPQAELDLLVTNSIKLLCKPISRDIYAYLLKTSAPTVNSVPYFQKLYPDSKQIFMYREGLKVAQSLVRSASGMPLLEVLLMVNKHSKFLSNKSIENMGFQPDMFRVQCTDPFVFCVYVWAVIVAKYLEYRKNKIEIVGVRYEDLVAKPVEATERIFEYCGLPKELAEDAVKALNRDAQRKSPLSMKNLSKMENAKLTPERKKHTDQICDQFDLPRIPEECILDGTISHVE